MKPRGTYLNEDYSQRVVARRKELIPAMKDARERGKIAYLSFDKLEINSGGQLVVVPLSLVLMDVIVIVIL